MHFMKGTLSIYETQFIWFGYQIRLDVLQLQILIQCCKLVERMYTLCILNTFTAFLSLQIHITQKNVSNKGCTP